MTILFLNPVRTATGSGLFGAWEDGRYFWASPQCDEMVQRFGLREMVFPFLVHRAISGEISLSGYSYFKWVNKHSLQAEENELGGFPHFMLDICTYCFSPILFSIVLGFYWLSF